MRSIALVVPCYNEAARLDSGAFEEAGVRNPDLRFVFVDDGSTDTTGQRIAGIVDRLGADRVVVLSLPNNVGKAEAVRLGVQRGLDMAVDAVGYWDADLATPLDALDDFVEVLRVQSETIAVLGSRVRLMGRCMERRHWRHYAGRVFATLASMVLGFAVYDTQCGAKLFRATPEISRVFRQPFVGRWAFDVELLARLDMVFQSDLGSRRIVVEYPLDTWHDVSGSKVNALDVPKMLLDLWRIRARYARSEA